MKSILKNLAFTFVVMFAMPLSAQEVQPMIGQLAPPFALNATNGKAYSLERLKGTYVVIHFAATWCPFCNAEAPNLEALYKDYREKGVEVLIVDVREDKELVAKAFNRFNFSFPILLDPDGKVSASYAPEGVQPALERHEVPIASNLIIDKEGKIRFYSLLNTASFDAKLTKLRQKLDELITNGK
jgi:peroxiredoxin